MLIILHSREVADWKGSLSQSRNYIDITYPADVLSQTSEAQELPGFGLSGETYRLILLSVSNTVRLTKQ